MTKYSDAVQLSHLIHGWFIDREGFICHTSKIPEECTYSVDGDTNVIIVYDNSGEAIDGATFWDDLESLKWCLKWCGATEFKYR